jgi:uncharacterized protein (DUF58 family)
MAPDEKPRAHEPRRSVLRSVKWLLAQWSSERIILTREGSAYAGVCFLLLMAGLGHQVNLILLVFALTAGPFIASVYTGRSMLRGLSVARRLPAYVFSGDPFAIDYTIENGRRWFAALAVFLEDSVVPVDRSIPGAEGQAPRVFFPRVGARSRSRERWQGIAPTRGKYEFRDLDLGTRSPFGLVEHRATLAISDQIVVYPRIGQLSRRWFQMQRQATESRRGQRHDRSAQHIEYHGLRDYRSGDSPRWIHWRTSARRNELMVKEFEEQHEHDVAILVDPWLPRTKAPAAARNALEEVVSFAATVCVEICRQQGRRLVLGWTGATPGVRQGPASVKLLHELLEQLAVLRPVSGGGFSELLDALPPAILREAILIIVSTRSVNLAEEVERSSRLAGSSARNLMGRVFLLNAGAGELAPLFELADAPTSDLLQHRLSGAIEERLASQERRLRGSPSQDGLAANASSRAPRPGGPRS